MNPEFKTQKPEWTSTGSLTLRSIEDKDCLRLSHLDKECPDGEEDEPTELSKLRANQVTSATGLGVAE